MIYTNHVRNTPDLTMIHEFNYGNNNVVITVTRYGHIPKYGQHPFCSIVMEMDGEIVLEIPKIKNNPEFHHISTLLINLYELVNLGVVEPKMNPCDLTDGWLDRMYGQFSATPIYLRNGTQQLLFDGVPEFEFNGFKVSVARTKNADDPDIYQAVTITRERPYKSESTFGTTLQGIVGPMTKEDVIELIMIMTRVLRNGYN